MAPVLLLSVDASHNRYRFFRVWLRERPEGWEVNRRWGRIGTRGRHDATTYSSRAGAHAAENGLLRVRGRHGYEVASEEELLRQVRALAHRRAHQRAPRQLQFPLEEGF